MWSISHVAEHAGKRHYRFITVPSGEKLTRQYIVLPDRNDKSARAGEIVFDAVISRKLTVFAMSNDC